VISPRDEIWIGMMQFDARAADRLWERGAPPQDAPGWYGDVSGLIETANGPAEPHELVDEPIVVEDMHLTTRGRSPRHCHRGRTVGRVIAMKAAFVTTAGVLGVAAAAAATTGIVATMASVVVPVIGEHVLPTQDWPEPTTALTPLPGPAAGSADTGLDNRLMTLAETPPATPTATTSGPPVAPEPAAASVTPPEPVPLEPVAAGPLTTGPAAVTAGPSPATKPAPPAKPPSTKPKDPTKSPPPATPPDEVIPSPDTPASPGAGHRGSGSGRAHKGGPKAATSDAPDEAVVEAVKQPPPGHSRRPG